MLCYVLVLFEQCCVVALSAVFEWIIYLLQPVGGQQMFNTL